MSRIPGVRRHSRRLSQRKGEPIRWVRRVSRQFLLMHCSAADVPTFYPTVGRINSQLGLTLPAV